MGRERYWIFLCTDFHILHLFLTSLIGAVMGHSFQWRTSAHLWLALLRGVHKALLCFSTEAEPRAWETYSITEPHPSPPVCFLLFCAAVVCTYTRGVHVVTCATTYMWVSEHKLVKLDFSFHFHPGSGHQTQVASQVVLPAPWRLSFIYLLLLLLFSFLFLL